MSGIDVTTLALAVDSTAVNTASAALDKMAAAGTKAETTAGRLTRAAADNGKALAGAIAPAAAKAALSFKSLAEAQAALGPAAAAQLQAAGAFGAVETRANAAAAAVHRLGNEAQAAAGRTQAALAGRSAGAFAPAAVTSDAGAINVLAASAARADAQAARLGSTLAREVAGGAGRARASLADLSNVTTSLGASSFVNFDKVTTSLGATAAKADEATQAVHRLRNEIALTGPLATATTSLGATTGPVNRGLRGAIEQRDIDEQARRQMDPRLAGASALGAAAAKANAQVGALGKTAQLTAFQTQQLGFQVHDFVVQVASGQNPITAFVQQGSQLSGTFGGTGNAFKAITSLITPFRLAVGGAAAAVGALAFAIYDGQKRSKDFGDALQLSGNYAGQTEGKFNALTIAISKAKQETVGNVRAIAEALLRSGEIGPQVFDAATEAAVGYARATGKTAEEVQRDFALMARSPAKFAAEANRQLNFLTAAQYASIKAFEDAGRAADAQGVVIDALNVKFPKLGSHLNGLTRWLSETQTAWTRMWASAIAPATIEDRISQVAARLAGLQQAGPNRTIAENAGGAGFVGPSTGRASVASLAAAEVSLADLRRRQFRQTENAAAAAFKAEAEKAAIAADAVVDGYLRRGKAAATYKQKLDELNRSFQAKELAGVPVSAGDKSIAIAELKREFTTRGARGGNEAGQVALARAEGDEKRIQSLLEERKQAFAYAERFLQGAYQAGESSLAEYFDRRRDTIATGVEAEIAALEDKRARYVALLKDPALKDPSQRETIKNKIDDVTDQAARLRAAAAQAAALANQEETASFKALNEQVLSYRANLLQLQGDELGAARVRGELAAAQLRTLARQSAGASNPITRADEEANAKAIRDQIAIQAAKTGISQINEILVQEEERLALAQHRGAIGEIEAMQRTGAARAMVVNELEKIVAAQEAIARTRPQDYQLHIDTSRARLELEKLKAEIDPLKRKFDDTLRSAGENFFADLMNAKKPLDALKAFFNSVGAEINSVVAKQLSQQVFGEGKILGGAGGVLASIFGEKGGASGKLSVDTSAVQQAFSALRAAGIDPATSALARLQVAADGAAGSLGAGGVPRVPFQSAVTTGDFSRMDRGQTKTGETAVMAMFKDAQKSGDQLASVNDAAATSILQFAQAAARGGDAMSLLPSIISMIQAAVAAMTAGGGGGGGGGNFLSSIFSMFGGGGGGGSFAGTTGLEGMSPDTLALFYGDKGGYTGNRGVDQIAGVVHGKEYVFSAPAVKTIGLEALEDMHRDARTGAFDRAPKYHAGGLVGQTSDKRPVPPAVFASAGRYHAGGTVGSAMGRIGLAMNEVPAILMGGPKGLREEVLTAKDPRHRDNITPALLQVIERAPGAGQIAELVRAASITGDRAFSLSVVGGKGGAGGAGGRGGDSRSEARGIGGIGGAGGSAKAIALAATPEQIGEGARAQAPALKSGEVPAILLRNEEVLTVDDPRHRARITPEVAGALGIPTRYHTGGIVGLAPDRRVDTLKPVRNPYLTMPAKPASTDAPAKAGGDMHFHITASPGVSREQAMNQGRDIGRQIHQHARQRGRNT